MSWPLAALVVGSVWRNAERPSVNQGKEPRVYDDVALEQSCTHDAYGFSVDYPRGWLANRGDGLPPLLRIRSQSGSACMFGMAVPLCRIHAGNSRRVTRRGTATEPRPGSSAPCPA
jgi:hypothetical protein